MKLIELLNKANSGRKIPMYVWDVYVGSRHCNYKKTAKFSTDSFSHSEKYHIDLAIKTGSYGKTLVEIDHLEEDDMHREVIFFLKIGDEVIKHYEPGNAKFSYSGLQLNEKFEIIGGTQLDASVMQSYPFEI